MNRLANRVLKFAAVAACAWGSAALNSAYANWTLAGDKKTMTDGVWTFSTSVNKVNDVYEITVGGVSGSVPDDPSVLDLRQPVEDFTDNLPCVIVGMNSAPFNGKSYPETLRLPDTFRTFAANNIFLSNPGLKHVEPFLPASLKNVNSWVFNGASNLEGDLVISNASSKVTFGSKLFASCKITTAKLFDGVTATGDSMFESCKQLKDVLFGPELVTAGNYTFNGCTGLTNVVFRGSAPDFGNATGNKQFAQSCTALGFRYVVPKWDFTWEEYLANSNAKTKLTAAEIETYKGRYGEAGPLPEYKIKISATSTDHGYETFEYFVFQEDELTSKNAVMVTTDSVKAETVSPAYGVTRQFFKAGDTVVLTAPAVGAYAGIDYSCVGYKLEKLGANGWETVEDVSSGNSCSYVATDSSSVKITWKWTLAGYSLTIGSCGVSPVDGTTPLGTVDVTPPDVGDKYSEGKRVTFTPKNGAGTFARWCGADVPAGHETDAQLVVTMDKPKTIYPYFATAWVYNGKNTLKDGYWTLAASGATNAIVVGKPSVNWAGGYLDLSKPIAGEDGAFVELVANFLTSNGYVEELILPENTIRKIGNNAFGNENNKLKWIIPFLPDSVEEIGEGICRKSRALNNPTFAFRGGKKMGGNLHFESNNKSLKEIILGDGVRKIPDNSFNGVSSVTNVMIGNAVTNIGNNAFLECSGVTHFEPFLPVGIQYLGTDALRKCGSSPNATFVVDNGKDGITFASQNLFFESNNSVSNMIVGAGVTALPDNFFKSGKRKLDEVMFKGFTTWKGNTFCTCEANKSRFVVSKHSDDWRTWYSNAANVKPWAEVCATDTAATNTYYQKWGATAKRPVGLTVNAPANVWIVATTLPGEHPGFKLLLQ